MSDADLIEPSVPKDHAHLVPPPVQERTGWHRPTLVAVGGAVLVHLLLAAVLLARVPAVPVSPDELPPHTTEVEMVQDNAANAGDQQVGLGKPTPNADAPPPVTQQPPPAPPRPDAPDLPVDAHGQTPPPAPQSKPQPEGKQPVETPKIAAPPAPQTPPTPPPPAPASQDADAAPVIRLSSADQEGDNAAGGTADHPAAPDPDMPNLKPVYPLDAARRGESGAVDMMVHVAPDGSALQVIVANSSGSPSLDRAATGAVRRWRFKPEIENGKAVESYAPVELNFVLKK